MDKTKVVTFRIQESRLEAIDKIVAKNRYYKRSNVIEAALKMMIALDEAGLSGRALSYQPRFDDIVKLEFEIRRKVSR